MRAIVQDGYGSVDVLRQAEIDRPEPGADKVLVEVRAAGLDRGTWHLMTGTPFAVRAAIGLRRPRNPVLGRDVAGIVAAVGSAVTTFAVGDEVYGVAPGSFAEYAVGRADKLSRKPKGLSFEQAAVVPISGRTALQALTAARVKTGQHVLITGASGGVGSYAVQLAKTLGAEVTGVASKPKLDLVRSLGADHVIDYTNEDFADGPDRYDVIIDIAGNPTLSRLRRVLTPTGTVVITGGEDGHGPTGGMNRQFRGLILSLFIRQRFPFFISNESGTDLEQLTNLIEAGTVVPTLDRTYLLDQAPDAMRHLIAGEVRGKVAITIS
ncbi:NAD(P)-dependent alcohol dehydrogenase [Kribbella sp. CA-245084]|uniref:NAD(P)-dependent alcohol dehydrogenase n=1 Tax=Kribbella sp. CA-245084 TaxID=3239940 RepID=UPI003D9131BC